MNRRRRALLALPAAVWPLSALTQPADMIAFTDPTYGYSVRVPRDWKPMPRSGDESAPRLTLTSPSKAVLFISVNRLAKAVRGRSEFEAIGESVVDPLVAHMLKTFRATDGGVRKKKDISDAQSLRFWEGTSTLSLVMLSLHAVRIGTDSLVNIVYVSRGAPPGEGRIVDAVLASLRFTPP